MTKIVKDSPGGAPGYEWKKAGDVVDVPEDLAAELLAIPDGGFSEPGTEVKPEPESAVTEPAPEAVAPVVEDGRVATVNPAAVNGHVPEPDGELADVDPEQAKRKPRASHHKP